MKTLVPVASFLFLLLISPVSGQDWSLQIKQFPHIVYPLEAKAGDAEGSSRCSAIVIVDDIVLTAGHCIPDKPEGRAVIVDEKHAEVLKHNTVLDLAVLKVVGLGGKPVALRQEELAPGTPLSVIGYGFGAHRLKYGFGWVSDVRDNSLRGVGDRLYFSATGVVPGDSGGAVVDFAGRLVTIEQGAIFAGPSSIEYGPPTAVLASFVKPFLKEPKP